MRSIKCLMAAAAFSVLAAGAAQAEDKGVAVDCADLDMAIKAPDFEVTCKDYSSVVSTSSLGRLHAELLTAVSEKQGQVIGIWDIRTLGNTYLQKGGLEGDIRSFFSDEELSEWHSAEPVAGFELAHYANRQSGGNEEECIAFRRQMTRRSGGGVSGFARMVLGFGCTVNSRDALIETLKQIDAPGG